MRHISAAILLMLLPVAFAANQFGYSRVTIERTWTIDSNGSDVDLTAAIAINNSNQRVLSVTANPPMDVSTDPNGVIWVHYQGSGQNHTVITAKAIVDIDYNTNIQSDSPLPDKPLDSTPLTQTNYNMSLQAQSLAQENSTLSTVRNLVNWVHSYVTYDLNYWGKTKSAQDVFIEKRGVCVEYTHLLISMARSLGLDTRYVSGYVYADAWQPHAWAEIKVPGYGWLPADATFGQVGILDNTHVAMHYAPDQSSTYDVLLSKDPNATVDVGDKVTSGFLSSDPKGISVNLSLDKETYVADVQIKSNRSDYVFGSYTFLVPDGYGGEQSEIMLLDPYDTVHRYQGLNHSLFQNGYFYTIPVSASFNDAKDEETLGVNGLSGDNQTGTSTQVPCVPSLILLSLGAVSYFIKSS